MEFSCTTSSNLRVPVFAVDLMSVLLLLNIRKIQYLSSLFKFSTSSVWVMDYFHPQQFFSHRGNVAVISLIYGYLYGKFSDELSFLDFSFSDLFSKSPVC